MTEDEISMKQIEFERETKEIKGEFSRLLLKLQKSLEKSCKLDEVVNLLINLDDEDWLKKCSTIAKVFENAKKFCSFYDNKAAKLLIEELGTDQDRENYEKYKRKFQQFCLKRVFLFPDGKSSKEVGMLVMSTDKHIEQLPLQQKKELQYEISRVFKGKTPVRICSNKELERLSASDVSNSPSKAGSSLTPTPSQATSSIHSESTAPSKDSGFTDGSEFSETSSSTTSYQDSNCSAPNRTSPAFDTNSTRASSINAPSEVSNLTRDTCLTIPSDTTSSDTRSKASMSSHHSTASLPEVGL